MKPRIWPPYRTVRSLLYRHIGSPAVILGGGESLTRFASEWPAGAVLFAINDHALRLLKDRPEIGRWPDYVVGADRIEDRLRRDVGLPGMRRDGRAWELPVIGRQMWADYRLLFMPAPNSGAAAAWLARIMGCTPIILAGMDLWSGATYHDAPKAQSSGQHLTPAQHCQRWITLTKQYPATYRTLGCHYLLQEALGQYSPTEPCDLPLPQAELLREMKGEFIVMKREAAISGRTFAAGERLEVMPPEAANAVKRGQAVRTNQESA